MIYYFYNTSSGGDIGQYDSDMGTFDDDWGSTIPTGNAALQDALHPVATKEDLMVFGNGRYLGVFVNSTTTLDVDKLDFGESAEVDDVIFHANQWWIAVNSGVSGTNRIKGQIYLYDGGATSSILSDETAVGLQKIGFLYVVNGVVYVAYQDLSFTGGYAIGYISDRQLKPLGFFTGSLPNYQQKTLYKNTILFVSSNQIYSAGAVIPSLPFQISQLADGGYETVGALAAPFGTPMVASHETADFTAATSNIITSSGHGLINTNTVVLTTTDTLPAGLSISTVYYVISATTDTFKLSLSSGGAEIDITDTGTGTHSWHRYKLAKFSGFSTLSKWRSPIVPLVTSQGNGMIDEITVLTKTLGANARCDLKLETDQATLTSNTMSVTGTGVRKHSFTGIGLGSIEDMRLYLDWTSGNATNDCPIRKILVKGHWTEV